jgi:catecholate siderophore receptor
MTLACVSLLAGPALVNAAPQAAAVPARTVAGMVVDTSGGAVAGATVTLTTSAGARTTVTEGTGAFVFTNVPDGSVGLTATFDRFAPTTITVTAPRQDLRLVLEPSAITAAVTVVAPAATALRTITAMRTDTPLRDVPQSVSIITRELIAEQTMRSMADVVNYVPGVGMAQGEGHRDAPIFRGNTSTSDFFLDGLRDDTQYLRDLYNLERVEVLKGPNGMIFGRGGVGGVINGVTRQADWMPSREVTLQGGSWGHRRLTADIGDAFNNATAGRVTAMYENSGTFRDRIDVERYGVNPTVAVALSPNTTLKAGYELFHDGRTTDRGIPSFQGRPLDIDRSTYFGSTDLNHAEITVNAVSTTVEHRFRPQVTLRNRTRYADYDKFYSNLVPGGINAARTTVPLTGYNSSTDRQNVFNQADLVLSPRTGRIAHTLLTGVELGRQVTDNRRLTAFFPSLGATTTSVSVPLGSPVTALPLEFRAAGSDADNHGVATTAAFYVQDQIALSSRVEAIVGTRYDWFAVDLLDNRTGTEFAATDGLVSPRVALIYRPLVPLSVYASYTRSYLPRAGEQLASLSLSNQALEPETFRNVEVGTKWEITPALSFTTAVYRLDHGNVVVRDALDPTVAHLVDAERTAGLELELAGTFAERWNVQGGYAYQHGEITRSLSATVLAGARLGQLPRHTFSLWNRVDLTSVWSAALGVIARSDSFVATDNAVVLPAFARVDGALFATISRRLRAQVNIENVFDQHYYSSAHNNNNIAPGSPRAVRVALTTRF